MKKQLKITIGLLIIATTLQTNAQTSLYRLLPPEYINAGMNITQSTNGDIVLTQNSKDSAAIVSDGVTRMQLEGYKTAVAVDKCDTNKQKSCIGFYDERASKFSLIQYPSDNKGEVTKTNCDMDLSEKNTFGTKPKLKSCLTFSQKKCDEWKDFKKSSDAFKNLSDLDRKAKECKNLIDNIDNIRSEIVFRFSATEKDKSEVQKSYDKTTLKGIFSLSNPATTESFSGRSSKSSLLRYVDEINQIDQECNYATSKGQFLNQANNQSRESQLRDFNRRVMSGNSSNSAEKTTLPSKAGR